MWSSTRPAAAQVHWDAAVHGGVARRVLSGGVGDGGFGPHLALDAHVALLPLLRIGAYGSFDVAPTNDSAPARDVVAAGLHVKGYAPFVRGDARAWLGVGFGYASVYGPSYHTTLALTPDNGATIVPTDALVAGAGGGHFEIPLSLGLAWRFRKPWQLIFQAGALLGFGFTGSLYDGRSALPAEASGFPGEALESLGKDVVTPFVTVGLGLDL